jgi:glycosyltransferase involved in cell wall biosynthesis
MNAAEFLDCDRTGTLLAPPRICIIALSAIADDPRVRRQGDALARAGWEVVAIGLPGARSSPPSWPIRTSEDLPPPGSTASGLHPAHDGAPKLGDERGDSRSGLRKWVASRLRQIAIRISATEAQQKHLEQRLKGAVGWALALIVQLPRRALALLGVERLVRFGGVRYRLRLLAVRTHPKIAQKIYWTWSQNILDLHRCAWQVEADIWLANDWNVLPIAARMAAEKGGRFVYDTHEFAAEEYAEKLRWRLWQKPLVCAIERGFIRDAAVISAVSAGIAERLAAMYCLSQTPLVVRNTPTYQHCAFRPTGTSIKILYHGIVAIGRGLEAAIDSVALWHPAFELTIRGPENPDYSDGLRRRIRDAGLGNRIRLVPPVPMTELVREAAAFDVGFFALPGHSRHNEFALPNKFFEYLMAGLALCVSDLPEMARLVSERQLGVLIRSVDPASIAAAINGLNRERIDAYKRNALAAASDLCWERESKRLVSAYAALPKQAAR